MDSIRVTKVERVICSRSGSLRRGTLHLTAHHLIFHFEDEVAEEMWVPYPLISLVTGLPQTLQGQCPLTFQTRTFETFSLSFAKESDSVDVFESVKELTVAKSVTQLYAFFYSPSPPLLTRTGWSIYSVREEFGRMGVGTRSKSWRFTDINKDYSFCSTYPSRLVVPTKISDTTLQYASKYRSKCRIPALTYLHWANHGTLTRSSQPMVGITQSRSIQDEKLVEAIFQSHQSSESRSSNTTVYGATCTNLIIDARPTTNAMANTAKGAGTENMDHYKEGKKAYLGIDHIHTMRESLSRVVDALREADNVSASITGELPGGATYLPLLDRQALRRSGWLRHISIILDGTVLIIRNVHINSSHVLIHCSDGWDRTSQLSSLAQLCLDPYYRTIRGFQILIEKDWLSFGHKFMDRCGHLSSEKFFISPAENPGAGGGADAAQGFLASMQNRFAPQHHVKETSPVFHQFLESVRQIQRQFPERFEFNQRFLRQIYYHLHSCQFGTFLFNSEQERRARQDGLQYMERTVSVWDFLNSPDELERSNNPAYNPLLDDPTSRAPGSDMGVLYPNPKNIRFWHELYGRTDEEMNGRITMAESKEEVEFVPGIESAEEDPVIANSDMPITAASPSPGLSPSHLSALPPPVLKQEFNTGVLTGNLRGTWSSLPDISQKAPEDLVDSPLPSSPSSSLQPVSLGRSSPRHVYSSTSPGRSRTVINTDLFASSGVKSIWGKLSSNASAALSVVQDAYDGITKENRTNSTPEENEKELHEKSANMRNLDHTGNWGQEPSTSRGSGRAYSAGSTYNPWETTKPQELAPIIPSDKPWQLARSPSPRRVLAQNVSDTGSLPEDPNAAYNPTTTSSLGRERGGDGVSTDTLTSLTDERQIPVTEATGLEKTDPLGVGLL